MAESLTPQLIFAALLGGILPALIWLRFWLSEDRLHPEPRGLIILAFAAGMIATACALPIEKSIEEIVVGMYPIAHGSGIPQEAILDLHFLQFFLWALAEEVLKFLAFAVIALRSKELDEPIDAVMYFVTVALGFAALENAMFLVNSLGRGDYVGSFILGNYRFIGATVLHIVSSAIPGVLLGLLFWHGKIVRTIGLIVGVAFAVVLHTIFNYTIFEDSGADVYGIFSLMWICAIAVLLLCERIKRIAPDEEASPAVLPQ